MSQIVHFEKRGAIGVIDVDNPPVNALSRAVRQGLLDALAQADRDPEVKAVVLACRGRTFFAGADITEFGEGSKEPALGSVVAAYEASRKPIVAAIHGTALGGGLEVALGCHYRVAVSTRQIGSARSQARPSSRRGRNPAPPAPHRHPQGDRAHHERRPARSGRGQSARRDRRSRGRGSHRSGAALRGPRRRRSPPAARARCHQARRCRQARSAALREGQKGRDRAGPRRRRALCVVSKPSEPVSSCPSNKGSPARASSSPRR